MEVYYWDGEWGLPSIDVGCLEVIAYVKFADVPVTFTSSGAPIINKSLDDFPILKSADGIYKSKPKDIIAHFEDLGHSTDKWMQQTQMQDVLAMKALVMDRLHPCMMYNMWLDVENYSRVSRRLYSKKSSFPLNYFIPGGKQKVTEYLIRNTKLTKDGDVHDIKEELHAAASECLNLLSSFLGEKEFFFGNRPSSFDAVVFAHLAVLDKVTFPNAKLQNHLKGCDNLCRYITRILRMIRSSFPVVVEETVQNAEESQALSNWLVPVGVAIIAMSSYAVHIGLLSIKRT